MKTVIAASIAALVAIAHPAQAQPTFANLQPSGLPTVFVTDRDGTEVRGRLLQINESSLTIQLDGGTKTYTPDEVSLVERQGDSLKNGTLTGMSAGLVLGVLATSLADCPDGRGGCPATRATGVLLSTAFYAAVGAGIDAAISGRTRIWPATHKDSGGLVASASPATRRVFVGWRISR